MWLTNVVHLALTYAQASISRNPLARHAAVALARLSSPISNNTDLRTLLRPIGLTMHTAPDEILLRALIHTEGSRDGVPP